MNYKPVIGLEVHVELKTKSKMFCSCKADYFGLEPNSNTCPVCLGLPGALPVPNKKAIEWCIMIGLALNCEIPLFSKFDRKNYFYPDLPKGYQISQYDEPFARNGSLELRIKNSELRKKVRIRRVHMEEDTGKLTHQGDSTLIDFNRSGVPLVEIVTEPDFESASEVVAYLKKLQQIVRYLGVSDADMEKGQMRLEPNISLREMNQESEIKNYELPKYKVEVKNINSFKFVEKAIEYEIKRQSELLDKGETPAQETRGWNEAKQKTISQRSKEEAHDYRYFPEPDIPPFRWSSHDISTLKEHLPELPEAKRLRFESDYSLSSYDSEILTREKDIAGYFEQTVDIGKKESITAKQIANTIINKKINIHNVSPSSLVQQIKSTAQTATIDENELEQIIQKVFSENKKAVEDFKNGKETVIMFLVGMVMRSSKEKLNAQMVKEVLEQKLKE